MNTTKIFTACLAMSSVIAMCLPALALKTAPVTGKTRSVQKITNKQISSKDKAAPVVGFKKK